MQPTVDVDPTNLVPIVGDGAIAAPHVGEGRLIPVLILDCGNRTDLRDLIYAHEHLPPGDVTVTWGGRLGRSILGRLKRKRTVLLLLDFQRPSQISAILEFDIIKQGGLVDGMLHAHGVYLQPTESGKRVVEGLDKGKILIEIPDTGFLPIWNQLYEEALARQFKKRGLSRTERKQAVREHMKRLKELWSKRMPGG